jgi:hypothetical protein
MAKKQKSRGRTAKKSAKKALRTVTKHGPLSAALAAFGALATSVLRSEEIQTALQDLVSGAITRASNGLKAVSNKANEALPALGDESTGRGNEHAHA